MLRDAYPGELRAADVGREVRLAGWVAHRRDHGGLIFVDLRDRSGVVQLVFDPSRDAAAHALAETVRPEYVLAARGQVVERSPETVNPGLPTGEVEVRVSELQVLNAARTPPFEVEGAPDVDVDEALRLKYRYLDLRRGGPAKAMRLRSRANQIARGVLHERDFLEIETPTLTRSTPEGARDFLVPVRLQPGSWYALPQSPQLFKQLLMLAGYDRYMQIARCFRDEDLRADRQPEFTQIDLEMAFVDVEDVLAVNEGFLAELFQEVMGIEISLPLPRMTYKVAMDRYGSDKPDIRFGIELKDISDIAAQSGFGVFTHAIEAGGSVRMICVPGGAQMSRKEIDSLGEHVKTYRAKGLAWITVEEHPRGSITKFVDDAMLKAMAERAGALAGDVLLIVADQNEVVFSALGALRTEVAKRLNLIPKDQYKLLWVTEFPLLEFDAESNRYVAMHHPFTSPMDEDIPMLETSPGQVRAKAYDIILNGTELGGGSIRIHNQALQQKMFSLLGFTKAQAWSRFGFLLEAFRYGVPPHGGLAYGLDRIVMLLGGLDSIRDVIAFPKVQNSSCLMTEAPGFVDQKQLDELGLMLAPAAAEEMSAETARLEKADNLEPEEG